MVVRWLFNDERRGSVIYERLTQPNPGYRYTASPATLDRFLRGLQR